MDIESRGRVGKRQEEWGENPSFTIQVRLFRSLQISSMTINSKYASINSQRCWEEGMAQSSFVVIVVVVVIQYGWLIRKATVMAALGK